MANIKINVDTAEFDKLISLGEKFASVQEETNALIEKFNHHMEKIAKKHSLINKTLGVMGKSWSNLAREIIRITGNILSWKGIITSFKGLMGGGGGLFGLEGLAASAAAGRRQALGIGGDYGKMNSFMLNFQRLVDSQQTLSNVATSKYDVSSNQRIGMISLGLGGSEEAKKDPSTQAMDAAARLPAFFRNIKPEFWGLFADQMHISDIFGGSQNVIRMLNDPKGIKEATDMARKHEKDLSLTDKEQSTWMKLTIQLANAGKMIETVFQRKLMTLSASVGDLSEVLTNKFTAIINSPGFDFLVKKFSQGLDYITSILNDPELESKIKKFANNVWQHVTDMNIIISKIHELLKYFGLVSDDTSASVSDPGGSSSGTSTYGSMNAAERAIGGDGSPPDVSSTVKSEKLNNNQKALLDVIASGESKGEYNIINGGGHFSDYSQQPGGKASGRYQDLAPTWAGLQKKYGYKDFKPETQDEANWHLAEDDYKKNTGRDLNDALEKKDWASIKTGLSPTWVSWYNFSSANLQKAFEKAKEREIGKYAKPAPRGAPASDSPPKLPADTPLPPKKPKNVSDNSMWNHRPTFAINVYGQVGANPIAGASMLGLGVRG